MRFLRMGALALSLAALPTQSASASGHSKLSFGFNFCWERQGGDHERCVTRYRSSHAHQGHHDQHSGYVVVMPGQGNAEGQPGQWRQAPPPGQDRRPPDRKQEEIMLEWGYPGLGYSFYHPVSYVPSPPAETEAPAYYYYVPQMYNPPSYWYPGGYSSPGVTFDR